MPPTLLQLKLTLADIKPPIWRRLLVPNDISLKRLHQIIQVVAEWEDDHLHEFAIAGTHYGRPDPHGGLPFRNDAHIRLNALPLTEETSFKYVYDFGDYWEIKVKVEKVLPPDPDAYYPRLLAGRRAFPLEDSGGVPGYEILLEALSDPADPEHEEYQSWAGEDFDPGRFDLEAANQRLRRLQ